MKGYENVRLISGAENMDQYGRRQPADRKEQNMRRFVQHDTQIMVSTTVIEVGVDVQCFRVDGDRKALKIWLVGCTSCGGRVGRGAEKSYCILMTGSN